MSASIYLAIEVDECQYILVVQDRKTQKWSFPGGRIKKGESCVRAAFRELQEETGLTLKHLRCGRMNFEIEKIGDMPVIICGVQMSAYQYDSLNDVIKIPRREISDIKFIELDQVQELNLKYPQDADNFPFFFSIIDELMADILQGTR